MAQDTLSNRLKLRITGTGANLVLLHGWGMNCGAFDHWLPLLEADYTVTLIDLPGFGLNCDVLPQPYDLDEICGWIENVLPNNPILVGWSLGGLLAQVIAAHSTRPIAGLVTVASTPYFVQSHNWSGIRPEVLTDFSAQLSSSYDKTLERFLAIQAMGSDNPRKDMRALKRQIKHYPDPAPEALAAGLNLLAQGDVRGLIGKITTPTLRLYGKKDTLVPVSAVDAIHALHPRCDNVILAQAAHAPFMSHPEVTTQLINQFVSGLVLAET